MNDKKSIDDRIAEVKARIAELEATPPSLVGSDEGTHGAPLVHWIYETIEGERYAKRSFAGSNRKRCTVESVNEDTCGRIVIFQQSTKEIKALHSELLEQRRKLRKLLGS